MKRDSLCVHYRNNVLPCWIFLIDRPLHHEPEVGREMRHSGAVRACVCVLLSLYSNIEYDIFNLHRDCAFLSRVV